MFRKGVESYIFVLFFFDILSLELVIVHGSITKKLKESLSKPLPPNRWNDLVAQFYVTSLDVA